MRRLVLLASSVAAAAMIAGCSLVTDMTPGQLFNDVSTTTTIKSRLAAREGLGTLAGVHVRTHNDRVYLTGTVPDEATRARIEAVARAVAGDNRVTNELAVSGDRAQARSQ